MLKLQTRFFSLAAHKQVATTATKTMTLMMMVVNIQLFWDVMVSMGKYFLVIRRILGL